MLGRKNKAPTQKDMEEIEKLIKQKQEELRRNREKLEIEKLNREQEELAKEELKKQHEETKASFDQSLLLELGMPYELWGKIGALYFDTDRTCQFVDVKIGKDGSYRIGNKTYDMVKGKPYILKISKKKSRPIYLLKHDNMIPVDLKKYPSSEPQPEDASRLQNLKTLETLSTIAGAKLKKGAMIILIAASAFAGFVIKLMLQLFNVW